MFTISSSAQKMLALLQGLAGVSFVASTADNRHVLVVPLSLIESHPDLSHIRHGGNVENVNRLSASVGRTKTPIYDITVYIECDKDGKPHIYLADGHQRYRVLKESGIPSTTVQWMSSWASVEEAMKGALEVSYARYEMTDADIISQLQTNRVTIAELATITGKDEETIKRYKLISTMPFAVKLLHENCMPYTTLADLIGSCDKHSGKERQLEEHFKEKYAEAKQQADHWANKIKADPKLGKQSKFKAKASLKDQFADLTGTEHWRTVKDQVKDQSWSASTKLGGGDSGGRGRGAPIVGTTEEWKKVIAIYNADERELDDLTTTQLASFIADLEKIALPNLQTHLKRKRKEEAANEFPLKSQNAVVQTQQESPPTEQAPDFPAAQSE